MKAFNFRSPVMWVAVCVCAYTVSVLAACALMWLAGDRWWPPTLLLYGPRWVLGLPLVVLTPLALVLRRRWLWPLGLAAVVVVWPIMGLNVPWPVAGDSPQPALRVVTYNVDRWAVDKARFTNLLDTLQPDLMAVQEARGWHVPENWYVERVEEMHVISAYPIVDVHVSHGLKPPWRGPYVNCLYCVVEMPMGRVGFANVHLGTPQPGLSAVLDGETGLDLTRMAEADSHLEWRRQESERVARWLAGFPETKIIAGDFNMPVESTIYRRYWGDYRNAFNQVGLGFGYSKQTRIRGHTYGTRIDQILTDDHWRAVRCYLGPDLGSDYLPLVADLSWSIGDRRQPVVSD